MSQDLGQLCVVTRVICLGIVGESVYVVIVRLENQCGLLASVLPVLNESLDIRLGVRAHARDLACRIASATQLVSKEGEVGVSGVGVDSVHTLPLDSTRVLDEARHDRVIWPTNTESASERCAGRLAPKDHPRGVTAEASNVVPDPLQGSSCIEDV